MSTTAQIIKGYELQDRIGKGGFGEVRRAYQSTVGREVAIKIILPSLASQPDFIRRFEGEAQLIARLEHPHITPLYDYWRDPDGAYLVMRLLRGGSLHEALQNGKFELHAVVLLLEQICGALSLAHRNGIIHRDIKPGNILLDEDGNAYLTDFGIAKDLNLPTHHTGQDVIVGSLDYISPEQARSEAVTARTDIYSLGVTLYEVIAGHHPFENMSPIERLYKHINDPLPEIDSLEPSIQAEVNRVIQKATAKNPEHRYPDALAFAADFRQAVGLNRASTTLVELLTQREQDILRLIMDGLSNKEIANELSITLSTVKWYVNQIYSKMGVRSRVQAIVRARELNLINRLDGEPDNVVIPTEDFFPENPYKGLRAFQAADNQDFFGREKVVARLVARMSATEDYSRFLAVVGPSGSGKSSLVKAGLIPALWRGELPGSEKWFIVEMLPGSHPLDELEVALTRIAANQSSNLNEHLRRDNRGLLRAAGLLLPADDSELVLVLDQFEEVFTLLDDEDERSHFLDLLYTAITEPRSRVRVIITLRADFYDRPLHYARFAELIRHRLETIMPLSGEELESVITRPAERVGVAFERGLVATIVSAVSYQPGALPLLQYALTELFEQRQGRLLTREAYLAIGETVGALAKRAEEIYISLSDNDKELARQVFLRLVTLGEGTEDTRRRVARSELLSIQQDSEAIEELLDNFAAYRLLSLDNDTSSRQPTVEIAHEALMREWERLKQWINENRADIAMQRQITHIAAEWDEAHRDTSYLVSGLKLQQMEAWAAEAKVALTPIEQAFLQASITERHERKAAEQARKAYEAGLEQKSVRRLQLLVATFAIATVIAGILSFVAFVQRNEAQRNALLAQQAANENRSLYLTSEAQDASRQGDDFLAIALLVEAARVDTSAEQTFRLLNEKVLQTAPIRRFVGHSADVSTVAFSPNGMTAVSGSFDHSLILWDIATGEIIRRFEGHSDRVTDVAFNSDGTTIVSAAGDGTVILWNVATGSIIRRFEGHSDTVQSVGVSPDGQFLLSSACARKDRNTNCISSEIILWDVLSGRMLTTVEAHDDLVTQVAFRPDEAQVLSISNNSIIVWQIANDNLEERTHLLDTFHDFRYVDYNPTDKSIYAVLANASIVSQSLVDGAVHTLVDAQERITTATISSGQSAMIEDDTLVMMNLATGTVSGEYGGLTDRVRTLTFSPNGQMLLSGSSDGTLLLWDIDPATIRSLNGHDDSALGLAISPDSQMILAGGGRFQPNSGWDSTADNDLILWNAETGEIIRRFSGMMSAITDVAISPDGHFAVSVSGDHINAVWDMTSGELLHRFEGLPSSHVIFSPNGQQAISSAPHARPVLWDIETGEVIYTFTEALPSLGNSMELSPTPGGAFFNPVAMSADGKFLASVITNTLIIWDMETREEVRRVTGLSNVLSIAFSPDGQLIATASTTGGIKVLEAHTGQIVYQFPAYDIDDEYAEWAASIAFSPDGEWLLSGWRSKAVVVWNMTTGNPLQLGYHDDAVWRVAFTSDGIPVSSSFDGTVRMWKVPDANLLQWLEANRYIREFTCEERQQYRIEPLCEDDE